MSRRSIRTLDDLAGVAPLFIAECECGHSARFDAVQVVTYFRERLWSTVLAHALPKLRCGQCGAKGRVTLKPEVRPRPTPPSPILDDRAIKVEIRRRRG